MALLLIFYSEMGGIVLGHLRLRERKIVILEFLIGECGPGEFLQLYVFYLSLSHGIYSNASNVILTITMLPNMMTSIRKASIFMKLYLSL